MNAPFLPRVLRSYQQRAATFLYERDAAFLIAPLGAGKGAAALTAAAELIRDRQRRHALVIAPKLVARPCGRRRSHPGRTFGTFALPFSTATRNAGGRSSLPRPRAK